MFTVVSAGHYISECMCVCGNVDVCCVAFMPMLTVISLPGYLILLESSVECYIRVNYISHYFELKQ